MLTSLKFQVPNEPTPTKHRLVSPRGAKLATRAWPTSSKPKALCLFVHGGGWHSGYFDVLGKHLNKCGIFCAAYDQINCGYSEMEPGSPGPEYIHFQEIDCLVEDLYEAMEWMRKEAGSSARNVPVFLFGESFGGAQVLEAAFQQADRSDGARIAGVVAFGCLIRINPDMVPPAFVCKILSSLAEYYPKLKLPLTDFETTFDDAFGDKEWAKTARADPKITANPKITLASAAASLTVGAVLVEKAREFPVPLLCIHGREDCRTLVSGVQELCDRVGPTKATLHVVESTGHQLLQDKPAIQLEAMEAMSKWMHTQLLAEDYV